VRKDTAKRVQIIRALRDTDALKGQPFNLMLAIALKVGVLSGEQVARAKAASNADLDEWSKKLDEMGLSMDAGKDPSLQYGYDEAFMGEKDTDEEENVIDDVEEDQEFKEWLLTPEDELPWEEWEPELIAELSSDIESYWRIDYRYCQEKVPGQTIQEWIATLGPAPSPEDRKEKSRQALSRAFWEGK
jgi:hypothetical protein